MVIPILETVWILGVKPIGNSHRIHIDCSQNIAYTNSMIKRIGFCCQWFHHDRTLKKKQLEELERPYNTRATTVRWLNEHKAQAEEKLAFVFKHNIDGIKNLILKVSELPVSRRMCRISSPILPVATENT